MRKILNILLGAGLLPATLSAATVNFVQNAVNDVDAGSIGAVSSNQYLETSATYSTVTAPVSWSSYRFTHWSNTSYPASVYRDAWGRSLNPISFVLLEDTTCTAHYLPVTRDSDSDGVPDWFEIEYYGQLGNAAATDTDGDGISTLQEAQGGTHPLYADTSQAGGLAYADSGMVTVNLAGFSRYTLRSDPAGTVDQSEVVEAGAIVTTPDLTANAAFGYWTLDGIREQDAWGVALPQISFTMGTEDREAVAYLLQVTRTVTACRMPTSNITTAHSRMARPPTRTATAFPCWRNATAERIRCMPTPIKQAAWHGRIPRWSR